ncbi:hypothetical protein HIM_08187 [Hirsutella minnesotensis 3608]|uniref:Tetrapyrrole biosynthesis uroporphyrinogen III synthase domain-containing protein n=1 Tax=Hirsutella minnesotensis 3608 TaxID=1043627 RepID=A0A0F8A3T4_9HYPO|nr:hypothetical protein HIM_08187 [Hirsutella minnesotensis 3608]
MAASTYDSGTAIPVLLLKTRSSPIDAYQELLSAPPAHVNHRFDPRFVPVLSHQRDKQGTEYVAKLLRQRLIGAGSECAYGGLIFTSQRAVEAFAAIVDNGKGDTDWPHLQGVPVYSVGPATTRALEAVPQEPPLQIFGQHCGNGEALAQFILQHYAQWYPNRSPRPPLFFLVGEQRRDVIPRTLMNPSSPPEQQIRVDEQVVYGTGVMESFPEDFALALRRTQDASVRWVVVFSPTGCDSMLRGLGVLNAAGKLQPECRDAKTHIATIGSTTKAHLIETFGLDPDVCADVPSPEGVLEAIVGHMKHPKRS